MADLSEPDFDIDDESVIDTIKDDWRNFHETPQDHPFRTPSSRSYHTNEEVILHGSEDPMNYEQLEILYKARGHELQRLKDENLRLSQDSRDQIQSLKHNNLLLMGDKEKLGSNLDHFQQVANAQSTENQRLRAELDDLKAQIMKMERSEKDRSNQLESKQLMVQQLQTEMNELKRSDTLLRAKTQHEETLRSLKERHENELFQYKQEIDEKCSRERRLIAETDQLKKKLRNGELEHEKIVIRKTDTIKELQDRLEQSQKKMTEYMAQTSAQGYTNVREMHQRFQADKEKYAADLCNYGDEIKRLKNELLSQSDELKRLQMEKQQLKTDCDNVIEEKLMSIHELNQRLAESEERVSKMMRESLTGSTSTAVKRLQEELRKTRNEIILKEEENAKLQFSLEESGRKYSNLKKKIKYAQSHWKEKETDYKTRLENLDDEFKAKLFALRDKMQDAYDSKLNEIETEMLSVQQFVQDELAKFQGEKELVEPLVHQPNEEIAGSGLLRPQISPEVIQSNDENHSTDQLTKLLQNAKLDARERLKRPTSQDRSPFAQINQ